MTDARVFAVSDEDGKAGAGQVVYWRLSGTVDPDVLAAAWEAAGLDPADLPELPAPSTALSRAVKGLQKGRTLVRPLEGHDGYAVVHERAKGDNLAYSNDLTVKLDAVGRASFSSPSADVPIDLCDCGWKDKSDADRAKSLHERVCTFRIAVEGAGAAHPLAATIRAAYVRALNEFDSSDVAPWLVKLLRGCDALTLREQGGVYYVPPAKAARWDAVAAAVRAASAHRIFRIPALHSRDVLDAVLDAVEQEAREEADAMAKELTKVTDAGKGLSDKVGKARLGRCDAVEQKVARYEALLGTRLDAIRERLGDLRASLSAAVLVESADQAAE